MGRIIFEQQSLSFEQIKAGIPETTGTVFIPALQFCQEWLLGKETFRLTTSGSTGLPKTIQLTRHQMEISAKATGQALHLQKGDGALVCLNTAYIAGIMMLVRGLTLEMDLILVTPTSSPLQEVNASQQIDFAAFVPLQLHTMLLEQKEETIQKLNRMKAIIVGGAAVNAELELLIQSLTVPVFSTYGMTETVSHIALRRLNGSERQTEYKTVPGVLIGTDERGCLKILSPATLNEWIQTNDVVELTSPDRFQWLGRADYTINSGGVKIQPEKLESVLEKILPENGIANFFIAGLPHPQLGEAVTLFVEGPMLSFDLSQMKALITERFHFPKAIIVLNTFPKTPTGKTNRAKIIGQYQDYYFSGKHQ